MKVKKSMVRRHNDESDRSRRRDSWENDYETLGCDTVTLDAATMATIKKHKGLMDMIIDGIDHGLLGYRDTKKEPVYVFDGNEDESVGHYTVYSKGSTVTMMQASAGIRAWVYNLLGKATEESERLREQAYEQMQEMRNVREQAYEQMQEMRNRNMSRKPRYLDARDLDDWSTEKDGNPLTDDNVHAKEDQTPKRAKEDQTPKRVPPAAAARRSPMRPRKPPPTGSITIHNAEEFFAALQLRNALLRAAEEDEEETRKEEDRDDDLDHRAVPPRTRGGGGNERGKPAAAPPKEPSASLSQVKQCEATLVTWQSRTRSPFGVKGLSPLDENIEATDMNVSSSYFSGARISVEDSGDEP